MTGRFEVAADLRLVLPASLLSRPAQRTLIATVML